VLGRPFGLRQMARNGRRVALVRDMTDPMYNPARPPMVSHYRGTELIVEHIEKYVAPTVSSEQILGGEPFRFAWDVPTRVLLLISEPEYHTWETLPRLAQQIWTPERGYRLRILIGDPAAHTMPGLEEALREASEAWFGPPAVAMGEGGSIPFMGMLGEKFPEAQFLITGVLGPQSNAHGPNEFLHLPFARKLTTCVARVIADHYRRETP